MKIKGNKEIVKNEWKKVTSNFLGSSLYIEFRLNITKWF